MVKTHGPTQAPPEFEVIHAKLHCLLRAQERRQPGSRQHVPPFVLVLCFNLLHPLASCKRHHRIQRQGPWEILGSAMVCVTSSVNQFLSFENRVIEQYMKNGNEGSYQLEKGSCKAWRQPLP